VKKLLSSVVICFGLLLFYVSDAEAALVTVRNDGRVVLNVLSSVNGFELGTNEGELEITSLPADDGDDSLVTLKREGEKVNLSVLGDSGISYLDVTSFKEKIVELERQRPVEEIGIYIEDGKFAIKQGGITALTDYSISVDPQDNELALKTSSGMKFLTVLPLDAVKSAMRAKVINGGIKENSIAIEEQESGELAYIINGKKVISIVSIFDFEIDVATKVSAQTGELISIDNPPWLKALAFLFV